MLKYARERIQQERKLKKTVFHCRVKKKGGNILFFALVLALASCAGKPATPHPVITEPPPPDEVEALIQLIKTNSSAIRKYHIQDDDRAIHVKGEPREGVYEGKYKITYDLTGTYSPGPGRLCVGFTLKEINSGVIREDSFTWVIPADESGILLSFDDNYEDVWEAWFDTLDKYDAKATFFVHQKSPFCDAAIARGHDIGYHSRNHLNLPKVSREVFFEETITGIDDFRLNGIPLPAFAYPFGLWEPWMNDELLKTFSQVRGYGVSYRLYDRDFINGAWSSSTAIDNTLYKDDGEFEKTITLMLRTAKFTGAVFPLTTHTVSDSAHWGIKEKRLIFLLETVRELGLKFYRYSDFTEESAVFPREDCSIEQ